MSFTNISSGVLLLPHTGSPLATLAGSLETLTSDNKTYLSDGTSSSPLLTEQQSASIINKTIDANSNTILNIGNAEITSLSRSKLLPAGPNQVVINDNSGNLGGLNFGSNGEVVGIVGSSIAFFTPPSALGITALTGDVSATGPGSVSSTVNFVGGISAVNVSASVNLTQLATSLATPNTLMKRDGNANVSASTLNLSNYLLWPTDSSGSIGSPDGGITQLRPNNIYVAGGVYTGPAYGNIVTSGFISGTSNDFAAFMAAFGSGSGQNFNLGFTDNAGSDQYYFGAYKNDPGISYYGFHASTEYKLLSFENVSTSVLNMVWNNDGGGTLGKVSSGRPDKIFSKTSIAIGNYTLLDAEVNDGNSGTSLTIDLSVGAAHLITLNNNCTLTISNGQSGGAYVVRIIQGASSYTVTWPSNVKWPGGTAPVITTTSGRVDLINLYYDGTDYYGSFAQNYTP